MAVTLCKNEQCPKIFTNGPIPLFLGRDPGKIAPQIKHCDVLICAPFPVGFYPCRGELPADVCILPTTPEETVKFFNVYCPPEEVCEPAKLLFFNVWEDCEEDPCIPETDGVQFLSVSNEEEQDDQTDSVLFFNVSQHDEEC